VLQSRQPARLVLTIATLAVVALGSAAGVVAQEGSPVAGENVTNVAVITPASMTNLGWDQQAVDGMNAVGAKLGITVQIAENAGYGDPTPVLKDLADEGAQLIVCHASGYQTICPVFAQQEQVKVSVVENPSAVTPNLISDIETQAQETAYLAGILAAKTTRTGTVGIVSSAETPTWNYMVVGFAEGVHATSTDVRVLYNVLGSSDDPYSDAAGAKRVTEQQLAAGADVVFGMGDGASFGMIEAIRDHNEANPDTPALFIDVIGDKSKDYGDVLLTSVLFDYTGVYEQMIKDIAAGTFGKVYTMDVKNNGVRLLDLPASVPQDVKDAVTKAQTDIVAGTIMVSAIGDAEGMKNRLQELGY
jgi:simple sugar transport system substrate-binding protein